MRIRKSTKLRALFFALPLAAAAPGLAQTCQPFWSNGGSGLPTYPVSMAHFDDGVAPALYVSTGPRAYRRAGGGWEDISATLPPTQGSRTLGVRVLNDGSGPALYAIGNVQPNITWWARQWTGVEWVQAPAGLVPPDGTGSPFISADLGDGPHIYGVVGNLITTGWRIARWDGGAWTPISDTFYPSSLLLIDFDDGNGRRLYALGNFVTIGSVHVQGFARWTGSAWEPAPMNYFGLGVIKDAAVYDDGSGPALYAHGDLYPTTSGQQIPGIGRWDGHNWSNMGGPSCTSCAYARSRIEVFDDGAGPALYVTGQFADWGGVEAHGIARWNGQAWSAVDWGVRFGEDVYDMVVGEGPAGHTLFIGGQLNRAGAGVVNYVAQRVGCPNCYANCDTSTIAPRLNVRDFLCFINKFAVSDPYADCNADIAIDVSDFACFLNKFSVGCP